MFRPPTLQPLAAPKLYLSFAAALLVRAHVAQLHWPEWNGGGARRPADLGASGGVSEDGGWVVKSARTVNSCYFSPF
jgi:hypothetical protein